MSAALAHPMGPNTVQDWLKATPPPDGSKLELILGNFSVVPPPSVQHQFIGDELCALLKSAVRSAGRHDLYVVTSVGVRISTAWRTGLIPDVVVLNSYPTGRLVDADQVELVAEVWSPGNTRNERSVKRSAYAGAGIRHFWSVDQKPTVITAYELANGEYVEQSTLAAGSVGTVKLGGVAVTFDPASLLP